jgi:hypothetical protein
MVATVWIHYSVVIDTIANFNNAILKLLKREETMLEAVEIYSQWT